MKQIVQIINSENQNIEIDSNFSQENLIFLVVSQNQKMDCEMKFINLKSNKNLSTLVKILLLENSNLKINLEIEADKNVKNTKINWQAQILSNLNNSVKIYPNMKIASNKVSASHGVTYHNLDTDYLFYLQSKGQTLNSAKNSLRQSFFQNEIDKINNSNEKNKVINYLKKSI